MKSFILTNSDHSSHKMIMQSYANLALQIQTSHDFQHTKAFMIKKLWIYTEIYTQDFVVSIHERDVLSLYIFILKADASLA